MITKDSIETAYSFFLHDHKRFQEDITKAVEILEKMLLRLWRILKSN